nr:immunoglobulin light chain junction region [Macaca mulatta]MOY16474.1 immunoglobulin light chain junction region [Macaca mulatta]
NYYCQMWDSRRKYWVF